MGKSENEIASGTRRLHPVWLNPLPFLSHVPSGVRFMTLLLVTAQSTPLTLCPPACALGPLCIWPAPQRLSLESSNRRIAGFSATLNCLVSCQPLVFCPLHRGPEDGRQVQMIRKRSSWPLLLGLLRDFCCLG